MKKVILTDDEYIFFQRYRSLNLPRRAAIESVMHDMSKAQSEENRTDKVSDNDFLLANCHYQTAELVARYNSMPENIKGAIECIFRIGDIYNAEDEREKRKTEKLLKTANVVAEIDAYL